MFKHLNFVIGMITIMIVLKFIFFERKIDETDFKILSANFNKVDGLVEGTEVRISGVKIGMVKKMLLEENKPKLELAVNNKINIPDDSSVSIQTDGLFGKKYLVIEPGGSDNFLKSGENISFTEDSILIQDILRKIIEIGEIKKGANL